MTKKILTIFGSADATPLDDLYQTSLLIGRTAAELGWTICNGGYGGTMEASARGAVEIGGHTLGVTCTRFGRGGPNPFIRQEIPTFDLLQRLNTLVRLGHAYVVLPGGTGTLAELALTWEMLNKGLLQGDRPLILYGTQWAPVLDCVRSMQPGARELQMASTLPELGDILKSLDI